MEPLESNTDPTPKKAPPSGETLRRQGSFLSAFLQLGRVNKAAERAGIDRWTHYEWLKTDPDYATEFRKVEHMVTVGLEDELYRRAVEGIEKPVTIAGQREVIMEVSDTLLIFMLKARAPHKYRDNHTIEHLGKDGSPLLDLAAIRDMVTSALSGHPEAREAVAEKLLEMADAAKK